MSEDAGTRHQCASKVCRASLTAAGLLLLHHSGVLGGALVLQQKKMMQTMKEFHLRGSDDLIPEIAEGVAVLACSLLSHDRPNNGLGLAGDPVRFTVEEQEGWRLSQGCGAQTERCVGLRIGLGTFAHQSLWAQQCPVVMATAHGMK
ncbi:hypothetical protein NDU88_000411 [Pleurodeles waltl]|uniref:Uncharacterized protein n=1 Tax=Pleurodeles waltl TaxID=8319 RepID=A0AAV7TEU5_PLEWA|nr:hypothetical protein NDU88_000411 [Pleurodeles waltl]